MVHESLPPEQDGGMNPGTEPLALLPVLHWDPWTLRLVRRGGDSRSKRVPDGPGLAAPSLCAAGAGLGDVGNMKTFWDMNGRNLVF